MDDWIEESHIKFRVFSTTWAKINTELMVARNAVASSLTIWREIFAEVGSGEEMSHVDRFIGML
jgi:hypothetical protein